MFSGGDLGDLDLGGQSLPGLDLGAASMPGLDLGAPSMPGLDLGAGSMPGLDLNGGLDASIPGMTDFSAPASPPPAPGGGEFATLAFDPSASRTELPSNLGESTMGTAMGPPGGGPAAAPPPGPREPPALDFGSLSSGGAAGAPEVDFSGLADGGLGGFGPSSGEVDFSSLSSLGDQQLGDNPFESMSFADFSSADLGGATGEVDFSAIADGANLEGLENSMDFSGLSSLEFVPPPAAAGASGSGDGLSLDGAGTEVYDLDDNALNSGDDELLKASLLNYKPPKR